MIDLLPENTIDAHSIVLAQGVKSKRYPQTINIKRKAMAKLSEIQATNLLQNSNNVLTLSNDNTPHLRHKSITQDDRVEDIQNNINEFLVN
jgi:hypothetical protein